MIRSVYQKRDRMSTVDFYRFGLWIPTGISPASLILQRYFGTLVIPSGTECSGVESRNLYVQQPEIPRLPSVARNDECLKVAL
jgi:hypothetical protein